MRNRVRITSVLFAALAVAACGKGSDKSTAPKPAQTVTRTTTVEEFTRSPAASQTASRTASKTGSEAAAKVAATTECPIDMVGTTVAYEPTDDGGALIFRTDADYEAMRERTVAMAMDHSRRESALRLAEEDVDDLGDVAEIDEVDDLDELGVEDLDDLDDDDDTLAATAPAPAPGELTLDVDARSTVRVEEKSGDVRLIFTVVGDADPQQLQLDLQQESARLSASCAQ